MFLYVVVPFVVMGTFALLGLTLDHLITLWMGESAKDGNNVHS